MKMKYYIRGNQKTYTLKTVQNNQPTKEAHYKFIKFKPQKTT